MEASTARFAEATASDAAQWHRLVVEHLGPVWSVLMSMGLTQDLAAEACQLTWLRLAESAERGSGPPAEVRGWLLETARHEADRAVLRERHMQTTTSATPLV